MIIPKLWWILQHHLPIPQKHNPNDYPQRGVIVLTLL